MGWAVAWLGCALVCVASGLQVGLSLETMDVTKIDAITETMHDLKTLALTDLHELEDQDHADRVRIAGLVSDLEMQRTQVDDALKHANDDVGEIDNLVVTQLRANLDFAEEQKRSINDELERGEQQYNATNAVASAAIRDLSNDFDAASQLSQQLADVMHKSDNMDATARKYMEIISRKRYRGADLPSLCGSRQELQSSLAALMQHLDDQRRTELANLAAMDQAHADFVAKLQDDMGDVQKSQAADQTQLGAAKTKREGLLLKITDLTAELAAVDEKLNKLREIEQWNQDTFANRYDVLSRTIHTANQILQQATLLQAKLEIRTASTR